MAPRERDHKVLTGTLARRRGRETGWHLATAQNGFGDSAPDSGGSCPAAWLPDRRWRGWLGGARFPIQLHQCSAGARDDVRTRIAARLRSPSAGGVSHSRSLIDPVSATVWQTFVSRPASGKLAWGEDDSRWFFRPDIATDIVVTLLFRLHSKATGGVSGNRPGHFGSVDDLTEQLAHQIHCCFAAVRLSGAPFEITIRPRSDRHRRRSTDPEQTSR